MLEHIFRRAQVISRLRSRASCELIEQFATTLLQRDYRVETIQRYVRAVEHFISWLSQRKSPSTLNEKTIQEFLDLHPRDFNVAAALRLLMKMSENHNSPPAKQFPVDEEIARFETHLEQVCGLAPATRRYRTRDAHCFLKSRFGQGEVSWNRIGARDLIEFVTERAQHLKAGSAQVLATSLRSLLKYAAFRGLLDGQLVGALPRIPQWRLSELPRTMTPEQMGQLFDSFDRTSASGRRDYAMAVCMAELGLRANEVAGLELKAVDWRQTTLTIRDRKTRKTRLLPMSNRCAQAFADYLRDGRPQSLSGRILVRHRPPVGGALNSELVRGAMRRAYARAQLPACWTGTHVLRHTCATRMHQNGIALKQIADILGHQSLDTASIYTKVNVPMLRGVALPWPEVKP